MLFIYLCSRDGYTHNNANPFVVAGVPACQNRG